ncbi:hypothetical protein [Sphaerotilus uruguayifluvii]|uniref:Uncharacterized protein n=1 Tax=Sphaerotilus uruguayifluvii TaxID=2735897 RepID=A0ABX2FYY6_9BURK|nr:hypothetical protein [Leptothrix sp. C29]NRT54410.1 hypothetical protein [Leptothrix sp. C29]
MTVTVHRAANGHLLLELGEASDAAWHGLAALLVNEYKFTRIGTAVLGAGEQIHPSFQVPEFTLAAGWDNWSGHYLLSESAEGDAFIERLAASGAV